MAKRFNELKITSVRIAVYDLDRNPVIPIVQINSTPQLYLLPAYHKSSPFKSYTDTPKV